MENFYWGFLMLAAVFIFIVAYGDHLKKKAQEIQSALDAQKKEVFGNVKRILLIQKRLYVVVKSYIFTKNPDILRGIGVIDLDLSSNDLKPILDVFRQSIVTIRTSIINNRAYSDLQSNEYFSSLVTEFTDLFDSLIVALPKYNSLVEEYNAFYKAHGILKSEEEIVLY